jgi:hypothetical protein
VASEIADEAVIFEHAQCIITTSCNEANQEKMILHVHELVLSNF